MGPSMTANNPVKVQPVGRVISACALPRNWRLANSPINGTLFDFVLVSSEVQYAEVLSGGGQPILITRQFSVTDRRGRVRLLLGGLIEPWRWRRVLLNEGINALHIFSGERSWIFTAAARLAQTSYSRGTFPRKP
jgi:hypothetical protein